MADLSDATGDSAERMLKALMRNTFRFLMDRYRNHKNAESIEDKNVRRHIAELNRNSPDDPYIALKIDPSRIKPLNYEGYEEPATPIRDIDAFKTRRQMLAKLRDELKGRFGAQATIEVSDDGYVYMPRSLARDVCQWARDNGWSRALDVIGGEDKRFMTINCVDESQSALLVRTLAERGYDVCRLETDKRVVTCGVMSEEDMPGLYEALAEVGLGADAISEDGRGVADVMADAEPMKDTARAATDPEVELAYQEARAKVRQMEASPATEAQERTISKLMIEGKVPKAAYDTYRLDRTALAAHYLISRWGAPSHDNLKRDFSVLDREGYPVGWDKEPATDTQRAEVERILSRECTEGRMTPQEMFDAQRQACASRLEAQRFLESHERPGGEQGDDGREGPGEDGRTGGPQPSDGPHDEGPGGSDQTQGEAGHEGQPETDTRDNETGQEGQPQGEQGCHEGSRQDQGPEAREAPRENGCQETAGSVTDRREAPRPETQGPRVEPEMTTVGERPEEPASQVRQRQYGAKEVYTGDRVVEATTMDRTDPVSSDGQDSVEFKVSEDDMEFMRSQGIDVKEDGSFNEPLWFTEENARAASLEEGLDIGRDEPSIGAETR